LDDTKDSKCHQVLTDDSQPLNVIRSKRMNHFVFPQVLCVQSSASASWLLIQGKKAVLDELGKQSDNKVQSDQHQSNEDDDQ
jgi:hypothetical protein